MKKIWLIFGLFSIIVLSACTKTDSQIEQERDIDIIRDGKEGCFVMCWDETRVNCGQPCPDKPKLTEGGDAFLPIEERLSETVKQVCSDTGGQIIIRNQNEVCSCPEPDVVGTINRFSPTRGCFPICSERGFRIEGKECIEIPKQELCENSGGKWIECGGSGQLDVCNPYQTCICPENSVGFTEGFGCDYQEKILEVNQIFSIYPIG